MTNIFTKGFDGYICDGETITAEFEGLQFTATIHRDDDTGEPWKEHDGHGPVSDWTRRDKLSGELILNNDGSSKRFYDFAEAVKIAKRDGWGVKGGRLENETSGQYAARAAKHDFEVLQAWCNDDWQWCGVAVTVAKNGVQLVDDYECALWGIEMNYPGLDNSYLLEIANEYASEAFEAAKAKLAGLCECEHSA